MITFGELERTGEEAVMPCFKILSWHSPGETAKDHERRKDN
jgi:hypothetical protein